MNHKSDEIFKKHIQRQNYPMQSIDYVKAFFSLSEADIQPGRVKCSVWEKTRTYASHIHVLHLLYEK